jgi:hypothetical protein
VWTMPWVNGWRAWTVYVVSHHVANKLWCNQYAFMCTVDIATNLQLPYNNEFILYIIISNRGVVDTAELIPPWRWTREWPKHAGGYLVLELAFVGIKVVLVLNCMFGKINCQCRA